MWTQLFIDATTTTALRLTELEPMLERFGALPVAPWGTPIATKGEYEVRILFSGPGAASLVQRVLEANGMVVTRTVDNED